MLKNSGTLNTAITRTIGPETKIFYRRYRELETLGLFSSIGHLLRFGNFVRDEDSCMKQAEIISQQTGVSFKTALAGFLYIRAGEQFPFDPLTLPWLN